MFGWRNWINHVINNADVSIVYQPIRSLLTNDIVGYEALSRFPECDGETFAPGVWFEHAKELGFVEELEIICITKAIEAIPHLSPNTYLSVNASASTILLEPFVLVILSRFPDRLMIELTEHDVVEAYGPLVEQLDRMRARGVRGGVKLAIDDVGSGYSNMLHIARLRPDVIKLDRMLITDIESNTFQQEIVRALASACHKLDISVVAEGIETFEEKRMLAELKVPCGQGYFLGRPISLESLV